MERFLIGAEPVIPTAAAIHVSHLWAGYETGSVLEDINLTVQRLDFIGLIGPNGGGKTTLLKVLLGLLPPTRGEVRIMGKPVREGRKHIGYVPQVVAFDHDFPVNVWDVARMGRLGRRGLFRRYSSRDDAVAEQALRQVEMWELRTRPIGELSGGQRQRVYIARALATEPDILLLDEPTASVDPKISTSIYELLQRLNDHVTIVLISHDMSAVSSYVKTVGCLNRHLFYHEDRYLTPEMLELAYQCPIDLIAHGAPHRVFAPHPFGDEVVHDHDHGGAVG
ncbi:MAG: metal ABC transporter ATP-binding protein [Anaerolineae bacterium]|nr:metal ABC transporter ATP-binding protein [Anaerolineae bacterium]